MSRRSLFCFLLVALLTLAGMSVLSADKSKSSAPAIDPRATQIVRQMTDYLSGLNEFTLHATTTMELVTNSDMVLDSDRVLDVYVQRPDHLRMDSHVPDHSRQIFYDGKTITIYTPNMKYYAVVPAPATIAQTIQEIRAKGINFPLADLLSSDPYTAITSRARHGYYIGESLVGEVLCKQVAFRGKDMDWQIWVEADSTPLPRRVVIVDRGAPGWPRYTATVTDWNTSPTFSPDTFVFTPPASAQKIPFNPAGTIFKRPVR